MVRFLGTGMIQNRYLPLTPLSIPAKLRPLNQGGALWKNVLPAGFFASMSVGAMFLRQSSSKWTRMTDGLDEYSNIQSIRYEVQDTHILPVFGWWIA